MGASVFLCILTLVALHVCVAPCKPRQYMCPCAFLDAPACLCGALQTETMHWELSSSEQIWYCSGNNRLLKQVSKAALRVLKGKWCRIITLANTFQISPPVIVLQLFFFLEVFHAVFCWSNASAGSCRENLRYRLRRGLLFLGRFRRPIFHSKIFWRLIKELYKWTPFSWKFHFPAAFKPFRADWPF